ncbi:MAG TPA: hypothetical protein VHC22_20185 [Pirellulales bacterium]|nr:hypothetical protein [Pirellulales bacterium]
MHRILAIALLGVLCLLPRTAAAEYEWVTRVRETAASAAAKAGQCWDDCTEACGQTTRRWMRNSADWWSPDARQQATLRYGLRLPDQFESDDRLVILIHGLDSDVGFWRDLVPLLEKQGYMVAPFLYPNDQPVAESARLLTAELAALHEKYPGLKPDIVAHSMGGMIARACLEAEDYEGNVERLVMLAPPNQGSCYSRFSLGCDLIEHVQLWYNEPDWSWTWMVTDGLGEARCDIAPGSRFLDNLNAHGRRQGVRYTIVAGNRSCGWRYAATVVRWSAVCLPGTQWGNNLSGKLHEWAGDIESREGSHDGLVDVQSALLPGVDDLVIVPADHTTIACSRNGQPPVAWPIIKDRLAR